MYILLYSVLLHFFFAHISVYLYLILLFLLHHILWQFSESNKFNIISVCLLKSFCSLHADYLTLESSWILFFSFFCCLANLWGKIHNETISHQLEDIKLSSATSKHKTHTYTQKNKLRLLKTPMFPVTYHVLFVYLTLLVELRRTRMSPFFMDTSRGDFSV